MTSPSLTLDVDRLTVRFGGLVAVDDVSLRAEAGVVTGLIGPNGAGKTTTFNAIAGVVRPATGDVRLGGRTLSGLAPAARAERGLGRTFQRMELFESMTVAENVALGPEAALAGRRPWAQVWGSRQERAEIHARADDAMVRCGITHLARRTAGGLSTGQGRLVELARAVASRFRFLLLDEPSSGLDPVETALFGQIIEAVVGDDDVAILLVEHDMTLVRSLCTTTYVLDFGRLVASGATGDVLASEVVRAAYLGSVEVT